ncbi:hypothetical protein CYY_001687 [Polysphondylium violaceum]|uniref:Pleckstrin domain-containing protein n=1 Tax=Polysphondylium violaceum TaxID=133409 RepID=A0A8J4V3U3_9MYCE|nr:hypothetical protein CYY_001687 [Polysphondylium violaceum]
MIITLNNLNDNNIQTKKAFTGWINQHLQERQLVVKDLATDFSDGVILLNLLEILSGKKIPRYVRYPKFLQHKIDNINVGVGFMEKVFDIKVVGCNAKDIVDGNLKQIMGIIFLLIQKMKANMQLEHQQQELHQQNPDEANAQPATQSTTTTTTKPNRSFRATLGAADISKFSNNPNHHHHHTPATAQQPISTAAAAAPVATTTSTVAPSNTTPVTESTSTPTAAAAATVPTTAPATATANSESNVVKGNLSTVKADTNTGISVSTIRSKFIGEFVSNKEEGAAPHRHTVSHVSTDRVLRKTESGLIMSGGLSFSSLDKFIEVKFNEKSTLYDLDKLITVQSIVRRFLARLQHGEAIKRYRKKLADYRFYILSNPKAYRGICKAQSAVRGRLERKRLYKLFPLYRRNEIVKEIMSTEFKYVQSLEIVCKHYLKESSTFITQQQVRSIFSQIEVIFSYNSLIVEKLQARYTRWYSSGQKIGDIFCQMTEFLKVYTMYVNNYNNSFKTITECMENPKFAALLERNRNLFGLDLSAFLIMPIQRIPRYILLLQDLYKNTSESHPDHIDLTNALKKMKDVAEYVNEKKREAENLNQVLMIQSNLTGKFNNLAEPHRRYVRKGPVVSNDKVYLYILFNDILVKTENKSIAKIRDSTRLSLSGKALNNATSHQSTSSTSVVNSNEGKSKYVNSYLLNGSSVWNSNPDSLSFQVINVVDVNETSNTHENANSSSSSSLSSSISPALSSLFSSGSNASSNASTPVLPSGLVATTSLSLEALSMDEKMIWMSEIDECINQLQEKTKSKKRALITDTEELISTPYEPLKDFEFSGHLSKKHSELVWKSKNFILKNNHLYYHRYSSVDSPKEPTKMKAINLVLCSVKLAQVVDHPYCFQLNTPTRIYFFACQDSTNLFQWISAIRQSIRKKLESLQEDDVHVATPPAHTTQGSSSSISPALAATSPPVNSSGSASSTPMLTSQVFYNTSFFLVSPLTSRPKSISTSTPSTSLSSSSSVYSLPIQNAYYNYYNSNSNNNHNNPSIHSSSSLSCSSSLSSSSSTPSNSSPNSLSVPSPAPSHRKNSYRHSLTSPLKLNFIANLLSIGSSTTKSTSLSPSSSKSGGSNLQKSTSSSSSSCPSTSNNTLKPSKSPRRAQQAVQDNIFQLAENKVCADCGASDPSWVSTNYGVVICVDCSSIHKHLPNGLASVKSVRSLSNASFAELEFFKNEGNQKANNKYERNVPQNIQKPSPKDTYETKLAWIRAKYLAGSQSSDTPPSPSEIRRFSIQVNHSNSPQSSTSNSPVLASAGAENAVTPPPQNVTLESTVNNNNQQSQPTTPPSDTVSPISASPQSSSPLNNDSETFDMNGLNIKGDTSNGKGTWRAGSHSQEPVTRKKSFLDRPTRVPPKSEHEGYLFKSSRPFSNNSGDWKKYLFIFKNGVLTYYKVDKKNKRKEKGIIDLFHSIKMEARPKQKYAFTVVTEQRLFFLAAETDEEMKNWVETLISYLEYK